MNFESILNSLLIVAFLSLIPLGLVVFFVVLNRKNHNNFIKEKELLEQQIQTQLLKSRVEIQEHTLKSISQEIHDNIGQLLSLIKLNLSMASTKYGDETLNEAYILLGQVITDLRNLNKTFNPDYILRDGILDAIGREVNILSRSNQFKISFLKDGDSDFFRGEKEVILFRMIQEALHNVVKHADAQNIEIKANIFEDHASFSVSDDGKGFSKNGNGYKSNGIGLLNLEERARLINAKLEIFSYPGAGTNIIIDIKNEKN
jgi:signal transduction histidine kinase